MCWALFRRSWKVTNYKFQFRDRALEEACEERGPGIQFPWLLSESASDCVSSTLTSSFYVFAFLSLTLPSLPLHSALSRADYYTRCWGRWDLFAEAPSCTQPLDCGIFQSSVLPLLLFSLLSFWEISSKTISTAPLSRWLRNVCLHSKSIYYLSANNSQICISH